MWRDDLAILVHLNEVFVLKTEEFKIFRPILVFSCIVKPIERSQTIHFVVEIFSSELSPFQQP